MASIRGRAKRLILAFFPRIQILVVCFYGWVYIRVLDGYNSNNVHIS
jgi:hypothetical protein